MRAEVLISPRTLRSIRQGEGVGAVGLAGKAGIAVRVDAGVGHGFLIGSFLPEFNAHVQGSSSAGTKGEHAQQQYRKQGGAYALTGLSHGYLPFFAAKAALSGTRNTGIFNAKIACAHKNVNLLREPFTKTLHIGNEKQAFLICWFLCRRQPGLLPGKHNTGQPAGRPVLEPEKLVRLRSQSWGRPSAHGCWS